MASICKTSESTYIFLDIKDHTLDDIDNICHLGNRHDFPGPRYGLGAFEELPLEIIHMVLIQLDIRSLTDFRRVNKRAKQVIDSIPQYRQIVVHAPASIRASLSIETARFFSCQDLYETLCMAECDSCGDFGGYVYLVTCRRVCFLCFTEKTDYLPLLRKEATRKFGLHSEHLAGLPCMKSLPGRYSPRGIKRRERYILIDHSAARQAGIAVHGTISSMEQYVLEMESKRLERYQARVSLHRTGGSNLRPPTSEDSFDGRSSNPKRFMGIIRVPFFDARTAALEWGLHCAACKAHHYDRPLHWRRKFTMQSFRDHIRECGEIIDGKHTP